MSKKDNIIALEERLRHKEEVRGDVGQAAEQSDGEAASTEPMPGKLVWLHCPVCDTLQYTEVVMGGGRAHNVCGTQVEEIELDIDVRAEYTIADLNLARLEMLADAVEAQRQHFREYQERLGLIAGGAVEGYPVNKDTVQNLPVADVDAMGLLIPVVLHDPARHFASTDEASTDESPEEGEAGEGERAPDPESPPPKPWSPYRLHDTHFSSNQDRPRLWGAAGRDDYPQGRAAHPGLHARGNPGRH